MITPTEITIYPGWSEASPINVVLMIFTEGLQRRGLRAERS